MSPGTYAALCGAAAAGSLFLVAVLLIIETVARMERSARSPRKERI